MTPDEKRWTVISDAGPTTSSTRRVADAVKGLDESGTWVEGFLDPSFGMGRPLRVLVRIEDGEWTGLVVLATTADPMSVAALRDARLGDLVEQGLIELAKYVTEPPGPVVSLPQDEEDALAYRPDDRVRQTAHHLRMVASLYAVAGRLSPTAPQKWMADWWGVSPVRISRWVAAARARGLIGGGDK